MTRPGAINEDISTLVTMAIDPERPAAALRAPLVLALACAAIVYCLVLPPAGASSQELANAIQTYNAGRYAEALAQFQAVSQRNGGDALSHYYMGLCYQCLNQVASAKQEYAWVYYYSTDDSLRRNAQYALGQLDRYQSKRLYQGQGNNFSRASAPVARVVQREPEPPASGAT